MKKIILSLFVILSFVFYAIYERRGSDDERSVSPPPDPRPASKDISTPTLAPPSQSKLLGLYRDGIFRGDVADAYYGNVEVEALIQNGKIADVNFLQYPDDRKTSIKINTQAMPYLRAEAVQAQSADVDVISGATQTSGAFVESLSAALAKAKN